MLISCCITTKPIFLWGKRTGSSSSFQTNLRVPVFSWTEHFEVADYQYMFQHLLFVNDVWTRGSISVFINSALEITRERFSRDYCSTKHLVMTFPLSNLLSPLLLRVSGKGEKLNFDPNSTLSLKTLHFRDKGLHSRPANRKTTRL